MKKLISFLLIFSIILSSILPVFNSTASADKDYKIDDVLEILKFLADLRGGFTDTEFTCYDLDFDGEVTINDALIILKYLADLDIIPQNPDSKDENLQPFFELMTAFNAGLTRQNIIEIEYFATSRTNAKISEVSYTINNGAAEFIYLAGDGNTNSKGRLGEGKVFLAPGRNSIKFTVRDSDGNTGEFPVNVTPNFDFGKIAEFFTGFFYRVVCRFAYCRTFVV